MIHISELSWERIKHPSEIVNVGDTVQVYIKSLDREKGKISLGYKRDEDNPWKILEREYPVGTVADVTVVGMTTFGAFARIIPGSNNAFVPEPSGVGLILHTILQITQILQEASVYKQEPLIFKCYINLIKKYK